MTNAQTEIIIPAGEPVIEVRRFFKAPPELVYRACTEGEYLRRWFGPSRLEVSECDGRPPRRRHVADRATCPGRDGVCLPR